MPATPSFWLDQVEPLPERPPLPGDRDADVCVIGGGFTGLWTAYELRLADPSLEVVVLEARHVGFGASGRNGGWVVGRISGSTGAWRERGGPAGPRAMTGAIQATVGEIGSVVEREGIDCDWRHSGSVMVAQSEGQLARFHAMRDAQLATLGPQLALQTLDAAALRERVRVDNALGGLYTPHCARVQPAKLILGLAAATERAGAIIHERTTVSAVEPGLVSSSSGRVRARFVVRATEGYTADLPGLHRRLLPMNSSMIVTEPIAQELWERIGWERAETMLDGQHVYSYSQRTADGRIAIGGRGVPYRFGSRTDREGPVPPQTVSELRERLVALFGCLRDVPVARGWHGILGVSRDWCPTVTLDRRSGLAWAGGYAGEGVAASNLAGRTLRDLILGRDTELARLPWVGTPARDWEPEPLRFLGVRGIYGAYRLADRREESSGHASPLATVADRVAGR